MQPQDYNVTIVGGGIAGLWLHHRLNDLGYHALLIENQAIGQGQTLSSQGIIHGGAKYSLNGVLSTATSSIADMPQRWLNCLAGEGEVDLSDTKVLTNNQLMWSTQSLSSKLTSFFSSKALRGKMAALKQDKLPDFFQHDDFKGLLYQLNEPVIDVPSLLQNLSRKWRRRIICTNEPYTISGQQQNKQTRIVIGDKLRIDTQKVILCGGEGNESLLQQLNITKPTMQRRPLHMVLAKSKNLQPLYAHCIGASSKPLATITSHQHTDGDWVWYIGGKIAEDGVKLPEEELIKHTQATLQELLPWLDVQSFEWATHRVNRAEPEQVAMLRPDNAFLAVQHNTYIAWPTKLALTPNLADQCIKHIQQDTQNADAFSAHEKADSERYIQQHFPIRFAPTLWDRAFNATY
ncbi:FAD-dependent oxidoreductase [Eionea flava]